MPDRLDETKEFRDEILSTDKPFNFYITSITIAGSLIFFSTLAFIGRADKLDTTIAFLFLSAICYAYFGRYLATIKLYQDRIVFHYCFPWNGPKSFYFDTLVEMDHKERPLLTRTLRWFRGYQWLRLKNEKGEVFVVSYNIDSGNDERLLRELHRFIT